MAIDHSRFYRYDELANILADLASRYPRYVRCDSIGQSREGRALLLVTLTDHEHGPASDKPAIWIDGNIHSVELSASTACLYFLEWMLQRAQSDPEAARALRTRAFYVLPRINPDGAEWALADRPRFVRSATRNYPETDEPVDGLEVEDIDGDGRILQMRWVDPNGAWKVHPDDARLLVRREPTDAGGTYYRVMPEGRVRGYDGSTLKLVGNAGNAQGLDLNRNFPSRWRQEHEQVGSGPYPTSEPEVRAVVEFISSHTNICIGTSFHTFSGVLLRPFGDQGDDKMPPEDLWAYRKMGERGEALSGYPAISVFHDFAYFPGEYIGGTFHWLYEHQGCFMWTVELWNPKKEAGIDNRDFIHWFRDHPPEDDLKMLQWSDTALNGEGHVPWRAFEHPQLGPVELGGWNRFAAFSNPPPHRREAEVAKFAPWMLWQALITPHLELREAVAKPVGEGLWTVRLTVQNTGWLPSFVTKMAMRNKLLKGLLAEISLPDGAALVTGSARQSLGELAGWSHRHTSVSFWPDRHPSDDRAYAEWVIRAPAGTAVPLTAWHERAGRVRTTITLGGATG